MPDKIKAYIKRKRYLKLFKSKNVKIGFYTSLSNSKLGKNVFLGTNVKMINSEIDDFSYVNSNTIIRNTSIGKFCSVGSNVIFGLGKHPVHLVSTHPSFYSINKGFTTFAEKNYFEEYIPIKVGNDVWIGYGAIIMGGVKIGNGAIIAAGAIVTKDVEPYSIVGGIPAKHIKFRFNEEAIKILQKLCWWDYDENWIKNNYKIFHNIDLFINKVNKLLNE